MYINLVLPDNRAKGLVHYVQLNKYKSNNLDAIQLKRLLHKREQAASS